MDSSPLPDIDDILDSTDSEASSSSSNTAIFDVQKPFVLELHDLMKDGPTSENATAAVNIKKLKKKKKEVQQPHIKRHESDSSATISETSSMVPSVDEASKEEYFDAHESYYNMPGFATPATVTTTSQSTNPTNPKVVQTSIAQRPPARHEDLQPTDSFTRSFESSFSATTASERVVAVKKKRRKKLPQQHELSSPPDVNSTVLNLYQVACKILDKEFTSDF